MINFREIDKRNKIGHLLNEMEIEDKLKYLLEVGNDVLHLCSNHDQVKQLFGMVESYLVDKNSVNPQEVIELSNTLFSFCERNGINGAIGNIGYSLFGSSEHAYLSNIHFHAEYVFAWLDKEFDCKIIDNFYVNELSMVLSPHSNKPSPVFDLTNEEDFQVALDFIQEYRHDNLIVQRDFVYYFNGANHFNGLSIENLIWKAFNDELYHKQISRILRKMLNACFT